MFTEIYEPVYLFMERGGEVLYAIFALIFILWLLVLERVVFFSWVHKNAMKEALSEWSARAERRSWHAHQIRLDLISKLNSDLTANMSTIKMAKKAELRSQKE